MTSFALIWPVWCRMFRIFALDLLLLHQESNIYNKTGCFRACNFTKFAEGLKFYYYWSNVYIWIVTDISRRNRNKIICNRTYLSIRKVSEWDNLQLYYKMSNLVFRAALTFSLNLAHSMSINRPHWEQSTHEWRAPFAGASPFERWLLPGAPFSVRIADFSFLLIFILFILVFKMIEFQCSVICSKKFLCFWLQDPPPPAPSKWLTSLNQYISRKYISWSYSSLSTFSKSFYSKKKFSLHFLFS